MSSGSKLEIGTDLFAAVKQIVGDVSDAPVPVVILSAYLHALAKNYGLSESLRLPESQLGRATVPAPARAVVNHCLPEDGGALRSRIYRVLVTLSQDASALAALNRNAPLTDVGLLKVGQIFWNLEWDESRSLLPIPAGQSFTSDGQTIVADIKVPGQDEDFSTMPWANRMEIGASGLGAGQAYKSSGQGFRTKGARLAVLAAQTLVAESARLSPSLYGSALVVPHSEGTRASIVWPEQEVVAATPGTTPAQEVPPQVRESEGPAQRIVIGGPTDVGVYQRRGFDEELEQIWSEGGDRRVWLRGGPGLGKSYSARRVMQDAIASRDPNREDLLVWVDSADATSVTAAYSAAVDRLRQAGFFVGGGTDDHDDLKARSLLEALATSTWRWLIVLDNADAEDLIQKRWIPTGANPYGRVMITTQSQDQRIFSSGQVVSASLFTPEEAAAYVQKEVHARGSDRTPHSLASDRESLSDALGNHPLALSIATATISTNAISVSDWLAEFTTSETMDDAADGLDKGGYPLLIGATWRLALSQASQGLPDGVVHRAAMVAALQDPDGHPTWLWDSDALTAWVAGESTFSRRHGVPVPIQRLIAHGVLELRGHTWNVSRLAIHHLAARAVRELADAEMLSELASILTNEWLLRLTDPTSPAEASTLRSNLRPIAALPDLSMATRRTVLALLDSSRPQTPNALAVKTSAVEKFSVYLRRGGPTGLAELARQFENIGWDERELGRFDEGAARHVQAVQIYEQLIDVPSVPEDLRAGYARRLGRLQLTLDRPADAQQSYARAVRAYQRLLDTGSEASRLASLSALAELHQVLGNAEARNGILGEVDKIVKRGIAIDPIGDDAIATELAESLWRIGSQLRGLDQTEAAEDLFDRAIDAFRSVDPSLERYAAQQSTALLQEMADLHIGAGQWNDAMRCLKQVVSGSTAGAKAHVLLASVQQRLGLATDATTTLAHAAERASLGERPGSRPSDGDQADIRRLVYRAHEAILTGLVGTAMQRRLWEDAAGLNAGLLEIARERAEASPGDGEHDLARAHQAHGVIMWGLGRWNEANDHLKVSISISQMLTELDPNKEATRRELALAATVLGDVARQAGRLDEATAAFDQAVDSWNELVARSADDISAHRHLAMALAAHAETHRRLDNSEEATACYERCIDVLQHLIEQRPADVQDQRALADAFLNLGSVYYALGRETEALNSLTQSLRIWASVARLAAHDATTSLKRSRALLLLGWAQRRLGNSEQGLRVLPEAVSALQSLSEDDPGNHEAQAMLALALATLGEMHHTESRLELAEDCLTRSVNISQLLADLDPGTHEHVLLVGLRGLAEVRRGLDRPEAADEIIARIDDLVRRFPQLDD